MKRKEVVKIREKKLRNGSKSLYFDYTVAGKREYKFLNLYLVPEHSEIDRQQNKETRRIARIKQCELIIELQNETHNTHNVNHLNTTLFSYMNEVAKTKNKGTVESYHSLQHHIDICLGSKIRFKDIDKTICKKFVHYITNDAKYCGNKIKPITQHNLVTVLRTILRSAVKDGYLSKNPFDNISIPPATRPEKDYLTLEDIAKLEHINIPTRTRKLKLNSFLFCCFTGLRRSDVLKLKWSDIKTDESGNKVISIEQQKTKVIVTIPLSANAIRYLPKRTELIDGTIFPVGEDGFGAFLKECMKSAGINKKITFHSSRHTCASLLVNNDVDIYTVSKILGHRSVKTTERYAKVSVERLKDAVDSLPSLDKIVG